LRGKNKEKVKLKTEILFKKLKKLNRDKNIEVVSYFAHSPLKLRDNYIWQIMLRSKYPEKLNLFLKKVLKKFNPSNIIINVDID
jgi:primosomal protein N'